MTWERLFFLTSQSCLLAWQRASQFPMLSHCEKPTFDYDGWWQITFSHSLHTNASEAETPFPVSPIGPLQKHSGFADLRIYESIIEFQGWSLAVPEIRSVGTKSAEFRAGILRSWGLNGEKINLEEAVVPRVDWQWRLLFFTCLPSFSRPQRKWLEVRFNISNTFPSLKSHKVLRSRGKFLWIFFSVSREVALSRLEHCSLCVYGASDFCSNRDCKAIY